MEEHELPYMLQAQPALISLGRYGLRTMQMITIVVTMCAVALMTTIVFAPEGLAGVAIVSCIAAVVCLWAYRSERSQPEMSELDMMARINLLDGANAVPVSARVGRETMAREFGAKHPRWIVRNDIDGQFTLEIAAGRGGA